MNWTLGIFLYAVGIVATFAWIKRSVMESGAWHELMQQHYEDGDIKAIETFVSVGMSLVWPLTLAFYLAGKMKRSS